MLLATTTTRRPKACPIPVLYLIMSIWPFLAARCRGLVPLGSVVSPGLGSSKAAHMLLLSSSWTTLKEGRKIRVGWSWLGATLAPPQGRTGRRCLAHPWGKLTPTRPNSQARSRGVFPELSTMQGLD